MSGASETLRTWASAPERGPRLLGMFKAWRLQAYGYTIVAVYVAAWIACYCYGIWFVDGTGTPLLNDFTISWIAGTQALHGHVASLYDTVQFENIQTAVVGLHHEPRVLYPNWPYPPIFFLIVAPLALLSYSAAFLTWEVVTLLGCTLVVFLIVRRPAAVALVLVSPFSVWNFFEGQSGFLTASLIGAALLALERRPALAGVFIGCLTFKPQFGVLFPLALIAGRQWRTFASAAITAVALAGLSMAAFGISPWEALPRQLLQHSHDFLLQEHPYAYGWIYIQTVYGLVRALNAGAALAWLAHGFTAVGVAAIIWLVWRSPVRYPLKAATLSAATLIVTPFSFAYDMAGIAIPIAFLAADQIRCGLLRGEQIIMLGLFLAGFAVLGRLGYSPLGTVIMIALLGLILRRAWRDWRGPERVVVETADMTLSDIAPER
jgi:arabinofuranan 3-O-arabinosyltransferase